MYTLLSIPIQRIKMQVHNTIYYFTHYACTSAAYYIEVKLITRGYVYDRHYTMCKISLTTSNRVLTNRLELKRVSTVKQ